MEIVFLDTETTGLDDDAQVVEIAIVDGTGAVLFESLVKPTVPVDPEAEAIHGIGPERLASAPAWPEIAAQVRAVLEGKRVVIFNSDFDTRLLQQTATAHTEGMGQDAYDQEVKWILDLETQCAMYLAADVYGATNRHGTISLVNAAFAAGIEFRGRAHSAAGDAATTAALWTDMNRRERERENARKRRRKKRAQEAEQDAKPNALSKPERKAMEALKRLADSVLEGETCTMTNVELGHLKKMGVTLDFIPAKQVTATVRGKGAAFTRFIGVHPVRGVSGTPYRCYMPWQVKDRR